MQMQLKFTFLKNVNMILALLQQVKLQRPQHNNPKRGQIGDASTNCPFQATAPCRQKTSYLPKADSIEKY